MTTIVLDPALDPARDGARVGPAPVSLARLVRVELRKMFDTRSGFWLIASIVIAGLVSTVATVLFAPDADLTYYTFAKAIGFPMTVILPIIAVLAITGEWSQRSGLTTFTLVPHRGRVIGAKVLASLAVGVASMLFALLIGVAGNVAGASIAGVDQVWDVSVGHALTIVLGSLLCLLAGTILGLLFRSSPVALVAYFVYSLLVPTVVGYLASVQSGFADVRPWIDMNDAQAYLFDGTIAGAHWAHLATAALIWLAVPAVLGVAMVRTSEVK